MKFSIINISNGHIENIIRWDENTEYPLPETHEMREWQEGDEIYVEPPPEPEEE